ncbi:MAG TPA: nicotinate phosphoribosyltransferase [Desulfotomaculum sp.]|nr:MAG: Quinolinate phosphoribosyl transferase [Desulfotomaculum sp. 46_80]HAG11262.1 nicotinate phosphoribosyltransferase [Desulfotomaculum sp.]HBY03849.1 nicotinate phosphoribosyltransferase [Desulfotomaculum sp.]
MGQFRTVRSLKEIDELTISPDRFLFSASAQEIKEGWTTDIYFVKAREILKETGLDKVPVTAEVFARHSGILAGVPEVKNLLQDTGVELWSLQEGEPFRGKEVVMRISGLYDNFGIFETALLGILASSSGWATAARQCKDAAGTKKVVCFGARHVHPAVAPVMERAALIGGADGASCILGAKLAGREPTGTMPHAVIIILGDTVKVADIYQRIMPEGAPVIILVDTFKDEAEETLRVAEALKERLSGVRLDTPGERGGVTPSLVTEIRARLDLGGFSHVQILVSGGLTPERIVVLDRAGADSFGVGSYISSAPPIDMTMDLKEVDGKLVAKRGRIPGITHSPRLKRL